MFQPFQLILIEYDKKKETVSTQLKLYKLYLSNTDLHNMIRPWCAYTDLCKLQPCRVKYFYTLLFITLKQGRNINGCEITTQAISQIP